MHRQLFHAGALVYGGLGVLITGAPGSGKSSLMLQLLMQDTTSKLVADDQTHIEVAQGVMRASAPAAIAGLIECEGVGVFSMRHRLCDAAPLHFVVELRPAHLLERISNPEWFRLGDIQIPLVPLPSCHTMNVTKIQFLAGIYPKNPSFTRVAFAKAG